MISLDAPVKTDGRFALLRAIEEYVDPTIFNKMGGGCREGCAIGQVAHALGATEGQSYMRFVQDHLDVDFDAVAAIFSRACTERYISDFDLFLREYIRPLLKGEIND